jgi:hypothetical protein
MSALEPNLSRRFFCVRTAMASVFACSSFARASGAGTNGYSLVAIADRPRILSAAERYLRLAPATITSYPAAKSPGGAHDFFSQADYFWPDPANPDGPYINHDGQSNPDNFNDHRKAMIALSIQVPALTAAWLLTKEDRYGQHAAAHLRAWFVTPATRMNANLEYSQGVHGVSTGRSYGIIDTLQLVEVARAASLVMPLLTPADKAALITWFHDYLHWMQTSEKGIAERKTLNNHAICWALQAAEFARLIGDSATREQVRTQYKTVFLPDQMGADGGFPKELARTKPYSYSIFNFDVMATLCQSLIDSGEDLYRYNLPDGRGLCKAAAFLYPYLKDKSAWPYKHDVEHFNSLPVRSPGLLFSGIACGQPFYLKLWRTLNPDPTDPEIIRNYPTRQPLLWFPEQAEAQARIAAARRD